MSQTLLALLAISLATLVSFNQKRNAIATYESMIENEIEMAVTGSMMTVIELIGGRSFDEGATPDEILYWNVIPNSTEAFADAASFGAYDRGSQGCNLVRPYLTPECDDIDDLDGIRDVVVDAPLTNGRVIPISVDVDVHYVTDREIQTISEEPTRHKLAVVTARSPLLPRGQIVLERVFSYDPIKAEMDFETVFGAIGT